MDYTNKRFLILIAFIVVACNSSSKNKIYKQNLEEFIESRNDLIDRNGKIIVSQKGACEELDCATFFEEYQHKVHLYSKSEIFMYNFNRHIEIKSIEDKIIKYRIIEWE